MTWQKLSRSPRSVWQAAQNKIAREYFRSIAPFQPASRHLADSFKAIINASDIVSLPLTSKLDLIPTKQSPTRPRDFILQPDEKLIRRHWPKWRLTSLAFLKLAGRDVTRLLEREFKPVHVTFTTGRSANQIPILYSQSDIEKMALTGERMFEIIGAEKGDIVVNAFPFAPHLAFWLAQATLERLGLMTIHTGGGKIMGTQKIIKAIESLKATILLTMPGYGYHLLKQAVASRADLSSLKIIVMGGERVAPGLRVKMHDLLRRAGAKRVKILATYAFTEAKTAWVQCHEQSGYHLYPDMEYIELIDETGRPVGEGKSGQVVYTSLGWRGSVVIRYKTGDYCKKLSISQPCQYCGRTIPRLDKSIERKSDMVALSLTKIKGELVNLNALHSIVHESPAVVEWRVEIGKINDDPFENDEFVLYLAFRKRHTSGDVLELTKRVTQELGVSPRVEVVSEAEIIARLGLETELKEKRIIDRRKA